MSEEKVVLYERVGKVGKITLNNPHKANALTRELVEAFGPAVREADADPETNVILICGAGKNFTGGFDLTESIEQPIVDVPDRRRNSLLELNNWRAIWEAEKPVVCAVQRYCVGGGVWIAMESDIVVAADNAQFGEPELKYSYINDVLPEPWKMTMNRVKQFLMFGEYASAKQMQDWGVVNFVVDTSATEDAKEKAQILQEKAMEYAQKLAEQPAQAIRMLKYEINNSYEIMGKHQAQKFAAEMFNQCRINQVQEQAEFNKMVQEQGLNAAMKWKDAQGK